MIENEMGYRGSKSATGLIPTSQTKPGAVKEQRVDGSWYINLIPKVKRLMCLRCTLMGLERGYQIKVLSNQKRFYTNYVSKQLNPWFVTGFADAESSFNILIQPRSDSKTKWRVKAIFAIGLHKKDIVILENIKSWFGVGRLYSSGTKVYYRVESFKDLQVIIDHFDKYTLVTAKKLDYDLFRKCFNIIKFNEHLTEQGIFKLIEYKNSLNKGLSEKLRDSFFSISSGSGKSRDINLLERVEFKFEGIPSPYWIAGFVSGDGSFNIKTTKVHTGKVQLRFAVNLHIREEQVIKGLAQFFNFDINKYIYYTDTSVAVQIVNTSDILNIIIPFFNEYEIKGAKELDFIDFKRAAEIVKSKDHLTEDGFKEILAIKDNMNLKRK
jgi:LAGLIDADG endonuclease